MDTKICLKCGIDRPIVDFILHKKDKYPDKSWRGNICRRCAYRKDKARLKIAFLDAFNWECSCCGEKDPRFLTLDHVNNDGHLDRFEKWPSGHKRVRTQKIYNQANREGWPKDRYTCLCYNCNCARHWNKGICPHKSVSIEEYKSSLYSLRDSSGAADSVEATINRVAKLTGIPSEVLKEQIKKLDLEKLERSS